MGRKFGHDGIKHIAVTEPGSALSTVTPIKII
jgi:hypothetical protein